MKPRSVRGQLSGREAVAVVRGAAALRPVAGGGSHTSERASGVPTPNKARTFPYCPSILSNWRPSSWMRSRSASSWATWSSRSATLAARAARYHQLPATRVSASATSAAIPARSRNTGYETRRVRLS